MYDTIFVDQELEKFVFDGNIIEVPTEDGFQTKCFEKALFTYKITKDGRLVLVNDSGEEDLNHHGIFYFYTTTNVNEKKYWIEYRAKFTDGYLVDLLPNIYNI